ncbi:MAG: peroxide stress protein YaaA [Actinobacteria bacterium]|nr:peroxide stress protein YaaA [Actinomycetota bacterium]
MKILLPPSEGKISPKKLRNLSLSKLVFAKELSQIRTQVLRGHKEIDQKRSDLAINVYSGVLYKALDYPALSASAKKRADKSILIFSAAYGVLRPVDLISAYKFKPQAKLWKAALEQALDNLSDELVVDARSSTYQSMWLPNPEFTVAIRVFTLVGGKKKVITHMSKKMRGEVARFLLSQRSMPKTPIELFKVLKKEFTCSLVSASTKESWYIDVIAK